MEKGLRIGIANLKNEFWEVPFRSCLNLSAKPVEHDSDESELIHSHGSIGVKLVILGQSSRRAQPSKRSLDNPSLGDNREAFRTLIGAANHLQFAAQQLLRYFTQFLTSIARIGQNLFNPWVFEAH